MEYPDVSLVLACVSLGSAALSASLGLTAAIILRKERRAVASEQQQAPFETPPDWIRVVIEMHPDIHATVTHLRDRLGLENKVHVIQKAIQVLTIVADHGGQFHIDRPDGRLQTVIVSDAGGTTTQRVH